MLFDRTECIRFNTGSKHHGSISVAHYFVSAADASGYFYLGGFLVRESTEAQVHTHTHIDIHSLSHTHSHYDSKDKDGERESAVSAPAYLLPPACWY